VLAKFHQGVTQVDDEEIKEFCSAIYYQPPIHPTAVREWYNLQRLDAKLLELHRRRSIHVYCWSTEEFASLIAGLIADGLMSWKFADLYLPGDPRQIEFGLVLERGSSTGRAASASNPPDFLSFFPYFSPTIFRNHARRRLPAKSMPPRSSATSLQERSWSPAPNPSACPSRPVGCGIGTGLSMIGVATFHHRSQA
jgi:hypothetical protein